MNILEIINKIRTAVYGRDVRDSIADGIETIYYQVKSENDKLKEAEHVAETKLNQRTAEVQKMIDTAADYATNVASAISEVQGTVDQVNQNTTALATKLTKPEADGTAGQVLQVNENGETVWADVDTTDTIIYDNAIFSKDIVVPAENNKCIETIAVTPGGTYTFEIASVTDYGQKNILYYVGVDENGDNVTPSTTFVNSKYSDIKITHTAEANEVGFKIKFYNCASGNVTFSGVKLCKGTKYEKYLANDILRESDTENANAVDTVNEVFDAIERIPAEDWEVGGLSAQNKGAVINDANYARTVNFLKIKKGTTLRATSTAYVFFYDLYTKEYIEYTKTEGAGSREFAYDALCRISVWNPSGEATAATAKISFTKQYKIKSLAQLPYDQICKLSENISNNVFNKNFLAQGYRQRSNPGIYKSYAHKALSGSGAPTNTWFALRDCAIRGFYGAEVDLRMSSDGIPMIYHDTYLTNKDLYDIEGYLMYTNGTDYYYYDNVNNCLYTRNQDNYITSDVELETLTRLKGGSVYIASTPSYVLKRIDVGVLSGAKYAGKGIMTLQECLAAAKRFGLSLVIDIKAGPKDYSVYTQWATYAKNIGILKNTVWIISDTAIADNLTSVGSTGLQFFSASLIKIMGKYASNNTVVFCPPHQGAYDYTTSLIEACWENGVIPSAWYNNTTGILTENQKEEIIGLIESGVNIVSTNGVRLEDILY